MVTSSYTCWKGSRSSLQKCLEPLVAISGNTRGVQKALRGEAPSRRITVIVIVPKSLENNKFNFYDGEGSHLKETGFSEL